MSKKEKLLQNIRNNPKNVRYDVLRNILLNYSFKETSPRGGSSHYTFSRGIYRITIPKDNPVNQLYVKRVIQIIEELEKESENA